MNTIAQSDRSARRAAKKAAAEAFWADAPIAFVTAKRPAGTEAAAEQAAARESAERERSIAPVLCRTCVNWVACEGAEMLGQCIAGAWRREKPYLGSCRQYRRAFRRKVTT